MPEVMTVREVAEYLRLPVGTLYGWRYRGKGPVGMRVGRHVRYRRADVEEWLDRGASRPAGSP
jgi:excisionase family DNA binding protein